MIRASGLIVVVAVLAMLGGSAMAGPAPAPARLRVLQMNLCDSGIARCYTDRAMIVAAGVIRATDPDVVTLDEVCQDDVAELRTVLARARGGQVYGLFESAPDRRRNGLDTLCVNGQPYGIGLLIRVSRADFGYARSSGVYRAQDVSDPEERVWVCGQAVGQFHACATHLASTSRPVALAQCTDLLAREVPRGPTVVGGDFNLRDADMPAGFDQAGDGGVQHVVGVGGFAVATHVTIDMERTTDHPALLVTLTMPA